MSLVEGLDRGRRKHHNVGALRAQQLLLQRAHRSGRDQEPMAGRRGERASKPLLNFGWRSGRKYAQLGGRGRLRRKPRDRNRYEGSNTTAIDKEWAGHATSLSRDARQNPGVKGDAAPAR